MTGYAVTLAKSSVLFVRVLQLSLAGLAAVFVLGALMGNMAALAFVVIGLVALVLLAFVLVLEFIAVRPIQRRYGGATDA